MKLLILILIPFNILSQTEIKLDNNLTGILSTNNTNTFGFNYTGNNSIEIKKISIDLLTNYSTIFSPKIKENEFTQKQNIGFEIKKCNLFITHQYNHSLIRKISGDNWLGIGGGLDFNNKFGKLSLSYATIYQKTNYYFDNSEYYFRHSLRLKFKIDVKNTSLTSEYFYQPNIINPNDLIIYGNSKLTLFNNKPINLVIRDFINYRSNSNVKLIHNLSLGIGYKFNKSFKKDKKMTF